MRSRYLESLYIFYVLLNIRDKNPLYGMLFSMCMPVINETLLANDVYTGLRMLLLMKRMVITASPLTGNHDGVF